MISSISVVFIYPKHITQTREYRNKDCLYPRWLKLNGVRPLCAVISAHMPPEDMDFKWLNDVVFKWISKSLHPTCGKIVLDDDLRKFLYRDKLDMYRRG